MPVRLLLVDDHEVVRNGIRSYLETIKDFEVVGEAENGAEAVTLAAETSPDVILMDLRMPVLDGLGAIEQIIA